MWRFAMISPGNENYGSGPGGGDEAGDRRAKRLLSLGCFSALVVLHIGVLSVLDFAKPERAFTETRELSLSFDFADNAPEEVVTETAAAAVPAPAAVVPRELPLEAVPEQEPVEGPLTEAAVPSAAPLSAPPEGVSAAAGDTAPSGPVSPAPARNRSMTDAEYLALIMGRLEKHKIYPLSVRKRGIEGDVTVEFTIKRDGTVSALSMADPSGHRFLVQAAFETIHSASPFPVMEGREGDYTARVSIRYQLEDQANRNN